VAVSVIQVHLLRNL